MNNFLLLDGSGLIFGISIQFNKSGKTFLKFFIIGKIFKSGW